MSVLRAVLLPGAMTVLLSGCVVEERSVPEPPRSCLEARWVRGHYGPTGRWHRGHWRCRGVVEVIEVE
jgi:hypothetical protein